MPRGARCIPQRSKRRGYAAITEEGKGFEAGKGLEKKIKCVSEDISALATLWDQGPKVQETSTLAPMCRRKGGLLLLLDGCDELVQLQDFQEALAHFLRSCPGLRVLIAARPRMTGAAGGHFKVVHHSLEGIAPLEAARLFLRRAHRPIRWSELRQEAPPGNVALNRDNEVEVLNLIASLPAVKATQFCPGALIELANKVGPQLSHMKELYADKPPSPPAAV